MYANVYATINEYCPIFQNGEILTLKFLGIFVKIHNFFILQTNLKEKAFSWQFSNNEENIQPHRMGEFMAQANEAW